MQYPNTGAFSSYMDDFLSRFEFSLGNFERAEKSLQNLEDFYRTRPDFGVDERREGKVAVVPLNSLTDWTSEVKTSALFADLVICDDPLLYALTEHQEFLYENNRSFFGWEGAKRGFRQQLKRRADEIWTIMPLIQSGVVVFEPLTRTTSRAHEEINEAIVNYLYDNVEIGEVGYGGSDLMADCYIPILDERRLVTVDRFRLEFMNGRMAVAQGIAPLLQLHLTSVLQGMSTADACGGTFWTGSKWHWSLSGAVVQSLSSQTKVYSCLQEVLAPVIGAASSSDIISIRNNEEAFATFKKDVRLTEHLIRSMPDEPSFEAEAHEVFEELFRPSVTRLESAMRENVILRNLPWLMASAGFAYAAAVASSDPTSSAIFGTLSSVAGFGSTLKDLREKGERIKREPAYVYWALQS
ncbi:hypothetical protein AB0B94_10885 [Micromonospora sp. NPDC048986]|uniref:hypothetical protein n=1 Tax=Micromonospora sp. NPDC048986 TaxID=3155644 RepID=UPI00340132F4